MRVTYGYARVSTDDQDMALQIAALNKYGIPDNHIFSEHASGKNMKRRELQDLLTRYLRPGDKLVVWKLDRLGRDLAGVLATIDKIQKAGIEFVSLTEHFDTTTPMGKAFLQIALVFAELERNMISERTKAGMAARKAADPTVKWGAKHFLSDFPERMEHVQGLYNAGHFTLEERPNPKNLKAVIVKGMTAAGLMAEVNAVKTKNKARPLKNAETIRRWLRDGAPGLTRLKGVKMIDRVEKTHLTTPYFVEYGRHDEIDDDEWLEEYFESREAAKAFAQVKHEERHVVLLGEIGVYETARGNSIRDYMYRWWNGYFDFDPAGARYVGVPSHALTLHVEYTPHIEER